MSSRQGSNSLFSGLKKLTSRNENDGESIYSHNDKKRQPSVSSYSSQSTSSIQHSNSFHSIDTRGTKSSASMQSPPSPRRASNFTLTYKDINALTDMKPIPTVKSHNNVSSYQNSRKANSLRNHSSSSHHLPNIPSSASSSNLSNSGNHHHHHKLSHSVSTNATDFQMQMPKDEAVINQKFNELMEKRDFKSLPQNAKDEMHNYSPAKKWMLIYQDALGEHKKQERRTKQGEESVTPEFYVKKLIDKSITKKQLGNLWVSLRTESVDWVNGFIDAQGEIVLCNVLQQLHTRSRHSNITAEEFLDREQDLVKCIKAILNITEGADLAVTSKVCIPAITNAIISPRLTTRKIVTEMSVFLTHWKMPEGYKQVVQALDHLSSDNIYNQIKGMEKHMPNGGKLKKDKRESSANTTQRGKPRRFEEWFKMISDTLDGRGKLGSMVGASDEYKASGLSGESALNEYISSSMLLINGIAQGGEDFRIRTHIRAQFRAAGLNKLMKRFQELGEDTIDDKIQEFEENAAIDYEYLVKSDRVGSNVNLNDPVSLVNQVWHKLKGSEAEGYFLSTMQHIFLTQADPMKANDSKELSKSFRLIDGIVSGVSMHNTSTDEDTSMNIAIQRLYSGLQSDEMAKRAIQELKEATKRAEEARAERDELAKQLSLGANGMLEKLAGELREQEIVLRRQKTMNDQLINELDDLKKQHLTEKNQQELEMRELFIAISGNSMVNADNISNEQILSQIQRKLKEKREGFKKQSNTWNKTVEPNTRLRSLRDKMDDLGRQARELEIADFETRSKVASPSFSSVTSPTLDPRPVREDDLDKLAKLRKKLESLQQDSNDILKYSDDERFREIMQKKKYMAFDRLNELSTSFQDFNIDFNIDDIPETAQKRKSVVDPQYKSKLKEELAEIQDLKAELQKRLNALSQKQATISDAVDAGDEESPVNIMQRLENKYIGGKVQQPSIGEIMSGSTPASDIKSNRNNTQSFKPVLEEIMKKGGNTASLAPPPPPSAPHIPGPQNVPQAGSGGASPSSPLPKPPSLGSQNVPQAGSGGASPPPPPPPMPPMLSPSSENKHTSGSPPPPPPLPPMLSPVPVAGNKSPPPPPPPPMPGMLSPLSPPPFSPDSPLAPPLPGAKSPYKRISVMLGANDPFVNYPRPKRKLKQLHWEKLDTTENSVWDGLSGETFANDLLDKGIFDEMEELFAAKEAKKLAAKKSSEVNKVTFLARDINQQFGINLHSFSSLSDEATVLKILSCDDSVLENVSVLEFLSKREIVEVPNNLARNLEPYSTDWTRGSEKKPDKDPSELQRADRIYLELIYNLQHYWNSRMRALLVVTSFEKEYSTLVAKLQQVDDAVEAIQNSDNIRYVFNIILAFGNYMNDASKQARGFKLSTLQRLSFMKDDKNKMTFLHYMEKIIRQVYPQFTEFLNELKPVLDVAKVSIEVLENDCKDYSKSIKNVESSIDIGNLSDSTVFHPKDKILSVILPSLPDARRKSELLSEQAKIILSGFNRLMSFFGENTSDNFARNSFFGKFSNFIQEYQKAQKDNLKREEDLRIYEQRKLTIEKSLLEKEKHKAEDSDGSAVMDNLLEKLKQVGPAKGDPSSARRKALARKKLLEAKKNILDVAISGLGVQPEDSMDDSGDNHNGNSSFVEGSIKEEPEEDYESSFANEHSTIASVSDANDSSLQLVKDLEINDESAIQDDDDSADNGENDVGARARYLLQSLRGSGSSPSMNGDGLSAAQQLRKQRRLERQQKEKEKELQPSHENEKLAAEDDLTTEEA